MSRRFYIVDVFAEGKYRGNQLAVVRDAEGLEDREMQLIAREMNYSETTFILSDADGGYRVRIFTPNAEIPFAGHPTLGTAFVIQREIIGAHLDSLILDMKAGRIPVSFAEDGTLWMRQNAPTFGRSLDQKATAAALGLRVSDMDDRFPIQEVSTGLPFLIAPLRGLDAVKRAMVDRKRFLTLVEETEAKAILVFAPETYEDENDLNVRVFVDYFGIPEDPATGSANGCLAGYLLEHAFLGEGPVDVRVEQGREIGRPSLLFLRARRNQTGIDVDVGGHVVSIARGELL